jgi:uncharacterized protein YceK
MRVAYTRTSPIQMRLTLIKLVALLVAPLALSGCASAPVQQMSDARQAIRAAQEAGAAKVAPESLEAAQSLMTHAEKSLKSHLYRAARRDAEAAHSKATEALQAVQSKTSSLVAP